MIFSLVLGIRAIHARRLRPWVNDAEGDETLAGGCGFDSHTQIFPAWIAARPGGARIGKDRGREQRLSALKTGGIEAGRRQRNIPVRFGGFERLRIEFRRDGGEGLEPSSGIEAQAGHARDNVRRVVPIDRSTGEEIVHCHRPRALPVPEEQCRRRHRTHLVP